MIYYLSEFNNNAGIENFGYNYVYYLKKNTHYNIKILCTSNKCCFEEDFHNLNIPIIYLPPFSKHPLSFFLKIKNIFSEFNISNDVLIASLCSFRNVVFFHEIKRMRIRCVLVGHLDKVKGNFKFLNLISRERYKNVCFNVAVSQNAKSKMFSKKSVVTVIENGIDKNKYYYNYNERKLLRRKFNIQNSVCIGHIARYAKEKNQIFSLKLLKELRNRNMNAVLFFVGSGTFAKIKKAASQNFLQDYIFFKKFHPSEMFKLYSLLDICVLPSFQETFGLTIIEAAACSLRTISSINCAKLKFKDNINPRLKLDIKLWADKIQQMIKADRKLITIDYPYEYTLDYSMEKHIKIIKNLID